MFEETGTSATETDGFVNYPRAINGTEVAILFKEMDSGLVNVSLRSRGRQNVAEFARLYNGGGHQNAAAFRCQGSLPEVVEEVLAAAEEFIAGGER
jgi:phosphoesterase RecJ-like protein